VISDLRLIVQAKAHQNRTVIIATEGVFAYRDLLDASARVAACLLNGDDDLQEKRVAFLIPPGFHYVATQWGIWRAGDIALPLCTSHPQPELEYVIADSGAEIVIAHPNFLRPENRFWNPYFKIHSHRAGRAA